MLHTTNALTMACLVEPMLWFMALFAYSHFSAKMHFFSFRLYLAIQLAVSALSVPVLFLLLSSSGPAAARFADLYMQIFCWGAIVTGLFALLTLRNFLKQILASLVGLRRIALVSFQWILVVAFFLTLNRMLADSAHATVEGQLTILFHGITLTELVVLALLAPFTFVVRRSLRSHYQDVMMGLAMLAISNGVLGIFFHLRGPLDPGPAVVASHVILVATLIFWTCCFVTDAKDERPRVIAIDSRLVRWSEKLRVLDRASSLTPRDRP